MYICARRQVFYLTCTSRAHSSTHANNWIDITKTINQPPSL